MLEQRELRDGAAGAEGGRSPRSGKDKAGFCSWCRRGGSKVAAAVKMEDEPVHYTAVLESLILLTMGREKVRAGRQGQAGKGRQGAC